MGGHNLGSGAFKLNKLPKVRENVKLIKGWFNDTLPEFKDKHAGAIEFLHIDSDLYVSAKDIFNNIGERINTNTLILFDEYHGYPGWKDGEYKAWKEFVDKNNIEYEYLAISNMECLIKVKSVNF